MQTLSLALKTKGREGEPLPTVFKQLADVGCHFRKGWIHLFAAGSGGGKSAFSTFYALSADYTGYGDKIPGLYFSPDNDKLSWGKMTLAKTLEIHANEAEKLIESGNAEAYASLEEATNHLWIDFQASPTPLDIREEVDAFASIYGDWPHIIWIDNLMDVDSSGGGPDERSSQDAVIEFLKVLGKETSAAIFVLAHVVGEYADGNVPIPKRGLMNKIDKRFQVVLTFYRKSDEPNLLRVCIIKNRSGRAEADGSLEVQIPWIPELGFFGTGMEQK